MQWLDPDFIFQTVLPALNRGLVMSIALIVPSATIGFVLGVLTGVARVFGPKWLRSLGNGFTTIFRGVPLVVQLMILYFGLPNLGIYLEPYPASVLGFILCTGAYQAEYVRGALLSIRQWQIKAAYALGFTKLQTILWVVIPQAARRALPGCAPTGTATTAAPATPIPSPATNARSSATFRIDETSRKYSVALLSPSARRRAAAMLYPNWNTSPAA